MKRKSGEYECNNHEFFDDIPLIVCALLWSHLQMENPKSRLKGQHESEVREIERTERQTRDKYMEARSKLAQSEADVKNLHATVNQLEIQLAHLQKVSIFH